MLKAPTLHLDHHYVKGSEHPVVSGHPSYERPEQYDGRALLKEVNRALAENPIVIAEGFLLFAYPGFEMACAEMVHIDVPHEVLVRRRLARMGAADDVAGGRIAEADAAWFAHGETEWLEFGAFQAEIDLMTVVKSRAYGGEWPESTVDVAERLVSEWCGERRIAA
jgi:hypothetical protein